MSPAPAESDGEGPTEIDSGRIGSDPRASESKDPGSPSAELSDADAVAEAQAGDQRAFQILVERYQGRAYRMATRVLRNEESAKDAVQEAFIKAYRSLGKFEGRAKFYTWFYRLLLNQCLDMKRKDRPERFADFEDTDPLEVAAGQQPQPSVEGVSFQPAAEMMRRELQGHIGKAVEQLPEAPRQTLLMREVDGLSYAEIARALGIPKGTVMSRLHYARKRLQDLLIEAGVVDPERGGRQK